MASTSTLNGPLTFTQYFQRINEPKITKYWESFIRADSVYTKMAMVTEGALIKRGRRVIDKLPAIQALPIGAEPTNSFTTTSSPFEETLMLMRGNNDMDRNFKKDKNYIEIDPVAIDIELYMQARAMFLNNYFFNNSSYQGPTDDQNGFIGLRYRALDAITPTNGVNGSGGYGVNPACVFQSSAAFNDSNISAANALKFERDMERMFSHMHAKDGRGLIGFCSPQMMWQINQLIKQGGTTGGFRIDKDMFDRTLNMFMECEFMTCGLLPPLDGGQQTAPNISSAQDANGWQAGDVLYAPNANSYSSIVFVSKDPQKFTCWQQEDPWMVRERITGTRTERVMLDQTAGIYMQDTRGIGMYYGCQVNGPTFD